MRRRAFKIFLLGLILILVSFICLREVNRFLYERRLRTYAAEVLPLIEKATDRKLKQLPPIRVVEPKELISVIAADSFHANNQPLSKSDRNLIWSEARDTANNISGYYSPHNETIYILPSNLRHNMKKCLGSLLEQRTIERMIVSHELVHALQDQCVGLGERTRAIFYTFDSRLAYEAIIEGHASYIEEQVAELSGCGSIIEANRKLKGFTKDNLYNTGMELIAQVDKESGSDDVWKLLKEPPTRTYMVFHPDTYGTILCDFDKVMARLKSFISLKSPKIEKFNGGEWDIREYYHFLSPDLKKKLFSEPVDSQIIDVKGPNSNATITVYVIKNNKVIPEFIDAVEKHLISDKGEYKTPVKVDRVTCSGLTHLKPDLVRRYNRTQEIKGKMDHQSWVYVAKGSVVVRVIAYNLDVSDEQVRQIVEKVFARVPVGLLES